MRSAHYNYRLKSKFLSLSFKAPACWPLSFFFPTHYFPRTNSFILYLCPDSSPAWNDLLLIRPIQETIQRHLLFNGTLLHPLLINSSVPEHLHHLAYKYILPCQMHCSLTQYIHTFFTFTPYYSNYDAELLEVEDLSFLCIPNVMNIHCYTIQCYEYNGYSIKIHLRK